LNIFDSESETPELIWDSEMRRELRNSLAEKLDDCFKMDQSSMASYNLHPAFRVKYVKLEEELYLGGVYVRLYLKEPTYHLRDPTTFLKQLLGRWSQEIKLFIPSKVGVKKLTRLNDSKQEVVTTKEDQLELVTSAIVYLCKIHDGLCDKLAEWGYITQSLQLLHDVLIADMVGTPLLSILRILHVAANRMANVEVMSVTRLGNGKNGIVDYTMQAIGSKNLHSDCAFIIEMLKKVFIMALGDIKKINVIQSANYSNQNIGENMLEQKTVQQYQAHPTNIQFSHALAPSPASGPHSARTIDTMDYSTSCLISHASAPSPAPGSDPVRKTITMDDPLAAFRTETVVNPLTTSRLTPPQHSSGLSQPWQSTNNFVQGINTQRHNEIQQQVKVQAKKQTNKQFEMLMGQGSTALSQPMQSQFEEQKTQASYNQMSQQQAHQLYPFQNRPQQQQQQQQPYSTSSYTQRSQLLNQNSNQQVNVGYVSMQQQQSNSQIVSMQTGERSLPHSAQSQPGQVAVPNLHSYPETHTNQPSYQQNNSFFSQQQYDAFQSQASAPASYDNLQRQQNVLNAQQAQIATQSCLLTATPLSGIQQQVTNQGYQSDFKSHLKTQEQSFKSGYSFYQQTTPQQTVPHNVFNPNRHRHHQQYAGAKQGSLPHTQSSNMGHSQQNVAVRDGLITNNYHMQQQEENNTIMANQMFIRQKQSDGEQNNAIFSHKPEVQHIITDESSLDKTKRTHIQKNEHNRLLNTHIQPVEPVMDILNPLDFHLQQVNQFSPAPAERKPIQTVVETVGTPSNPVEGSGIDARTLIDPKTKAEQQIVKFGGAPGAAQGRIALLQSALNCNLPDYLLTDVLENKTLVNVKDPGSTKVHTVELLKLLTMDPAYGMKFTLILDKMPSWEKYKGQDHSLFITGKDQKIDYFLTDGGSGSAKLLIEN